MKTLKDLYYYRELLKSNIKKDLRGKYKKSILGFLWTLINPLLTVLIYAIIFPHIMKNHTDNYWLFLLCGMFAWNWFIACIHQGVVSITNNEYLLKKVKFPAIILPLSIVTSELINYLITCLIILSCLIIFNVGISWHLIFLPLIVLVQYLFTLGIVFLISALNKYAKDIENISIFVVNLLFYLTPILYTVNSFPNWRLIIFKLNVFTYLINSYRDVFFYHQIPDLQALIIILIISLIFTIISYVIFNKLSKKFAE